MKIVLFIFLLVVGLTLLVAGYTAPARAKADISLNQNVRLDIKKFDAQEKAKYPSAYENKLSDEQLKPFEDMTDFLQQESAETKGTIQYCTGWLIIAVACIVFTFGRNEKSTKPV